MINLVGPINSGAAVGTNGNATANTSTAAPIVGRILGMYIKYNDSPPSGTTDVVVATAGTNVPALTLLTITDAATDRWAWPRLTPQGNTGAALTALTILEPAPICDKVNIKIDGANAADNVDVYLLVEN
jgi:hypothetical protein